MNTLIQQAPVIPPMSARALGMVRELELEVLNAPQLELVTKHVFHAGMYFRTICIPAKESKTILTGALIKIPTVLILSGDATVFTGEDCVRLTGYHVMTASAGRKQAFVAHADTHLTMGFATSATSIEGAEAEFTDEHANLLSRHGDNEIYFSGVRS